MNNKCKAWIFIDGGNDTATCNQVIGHEKNHSAYRVGEWTDEDTKRAKQLANEW